VEALYTEVLEIYKDLAKEDQKYNLELANIYGNISFYQLFNKNFIQAEKSANEGLKIDPTQTWIKTNLAHALLFQGKFNEAQNIYLELKDQTYPEDESKTFRYYFLQDLDEFEKAGITHPDIPGIRELLVH
jgi:tetratricopeptide (TPR) repeat protein